MAKIKIHELAKELDKQSKDIISLLQEKGIEAKAPQSSIDDDAAQIVRRSFGSGSAPKAQTPSASSQGEVTQSEQKAEHPQTGEVPKKKKTIIVVSNPQNSKMQGQKARPQGQGSQQPHQQNRQNGQNSQGSRNGQQGSFNSQSQRGNNNRPQPAAPVRPIKPLTPPSPTPSVQMVPPKPPQPKAQAEREKVAEIQQPNAPVQAAEAVTIQNPVQETKQPESSVNVTAQTSGSQGIQQETRTQENPAQSSSGSVNSYQGSRPSGDRQGGYQGNRPSGDRQGGYQGNRPAGDRQGGYQGNRPAGDRQGGYQGNRPAGDRQGGYQGNRPAGDRQGGYQGNRPAGDRPAGYQGGYQGNRPAGDRQGGYQGNRPAGDRPGGYQGNRPAGDRPAGYQGGYQGNRPAGDRPAGYQGGYQGNRPAGDRPAGYQGGYQGNRPAGDRPGGYQGSRPGGQYQNRGDAGNGRPSFNRQDGTSRPGFDSNSGDRRFGGPGAGGNRPYGNTNRDGRPNGGPGDKTRGQAGAKGFVGEAPGKDLEKKREEEKRRFSQEKDKRSKKDMIYEEEEGAKNKPGRFIRPEKKKDDAAEEAIKVIIIPETITIKELAEKMKLQPAAIVKKLFLEGKIVTVNQEISYEDAEGIAMNYEILCEREVKVDVIEELLKEDQEENDNLLERPPVICVMGHVDHGKTSLLDAIRKTNVTDREAGGITQHIGAYTVQAGGRKITFLDTPGHEAFTAMRMRGANATDVAILVVAADDGVMPQTVEAINHAKAAGIEIIVAVNKIDKPSANIDRVKQELAEYELIPEDWGGSTIFASVSAKSGEGIEQLLEMILLTSDILELKANPERRARGLVIEAELDKGRGPVATVLVQKGTLLVGDFISAGSCSGKVRAMIDDKGRRVKEAGPSTPVEILGLSDVPSAGEVFIAHESDKTAKSYADTYLAQNKEKMLEDTKAKMSLDDLFSQIKEGNLKELNLIVKADVQGSVEAVKQSLMKLSNEEVVVKCLHGGVGAINESDVMLASASSAIIIGFNVRPDATAKATSEREGVDIRLYKVIYQAIEDIQAAMKGMLDPVFEEKVIGHAEVRQIFKASAIGNIAGSYVLDGIFQRGCKVRVSREGKLIFEGGLDSLKRFKDDVKEVKTGFECGLVFEGFDQMEELDIVEAYIMVEVPR